MKLLINLLKDLVIIVKQILSLLTIFIKRIGNFKII